jgi:hypothetical protein
VFPGGVIPQRAWSKPAINILPYIPVGNVDPVNEVNHEENKDERYDPRLQFAQCPRFDCRSRFWDGHRDCFTPLIARKREGTNAASRDRLGTSITPS